MGKKAIESAKAINKRMSEEYYEITGNYNNYTCPICNGELFHINNTMLQFMVMVMDGNTVYHCENHDDHTFWKNAMDMCDVLRLNKESSETSFNYDVEYKLIDKKWVEIDKPVDSFEI